MKSNEKKYEFEQIIDSLNLAVLTMDLAGNINYANKKMQEILAKYPDGRGTKCYEACHHIWSETGTKFCSWCGLDNVVRTGRAIDKIIKGQDGRQWLFSWAPIHDENQTIIKVVKTIADITEQIEEKDYLEGMLLDIFSVIKLSREKKEIEEDLKKKEKMLIDQDKLAAVGQLAAGIAHELNTPTTYVRGNMQTFSKYTDLMGDLLTRLKKDTPVVEKETILNKIEKLIINMKDIADSSFDGTSRIMKIISSMKTFVQSDRTMAEQINIYGPIQDALVLVFSRIKYSGKVFVNGVIFSAGDMNLTDSFKPIMMKGSAMRFTQLFIILLNNSIDAWESIPEKEKSLLKIEIAVIEQKSRAIIEVSDNGGGIEEGLIQKIFEPFYTTKAAKGGTGLGLSIARQIAAEHNSTIELKNMPGHGVCFTITTGGLEAS